MRTRRSDLEHQAAVSRRLALLGDELAGVRPARPPAPPSPPIDADPLDPAWYAEHTRTAPHRTAPVVASAHVPVATVAAVPEPGRHASRRAAPVPSFPWGPPHLAVVAVIVAMALGATCWWLVRGDAEPATELRAAAAALATPVADAQTGAQAGAQAGAPSASASGPATVTVDVAGKVRQPGIAVLDSGARVVDALAAAGGARPGVDLTTLNLARPLVDGEQLLVGLPAPTGAAAAASAPTAAATPGAPTGLVDLNTATEAQLDTLPEVGPVTAASILAWRTEHGSFTSVDELLEIDGIGDATLAKIAPYVTV